MDQPRLLESGEKRRETGREVIERLWPTPTLADRALAFCGHIIRVALGFGISILLLGPGAVLVHVYGSEREPARTLALVVVGVAWCALVSFLYHQALQRGMRRAWTLHDWMNYEDPLSPDGYGTPAGIVLGAIPGVLAALIYAVQ